MNLDIVIYAVIAIIIFARLWMVLGNRNESDRTRPNPFSAPPAVKGGNDETFASPTAPHTDMPPSLKPFQSAPASLAGGLEQIKTLDPTFDEKQFLAGARTAFTTIVGEFAKGDLGASASLLGPGVAAKFHAAIEARRAAGQVLENKIVRIRDAETAAVRVDGTQAVITVRFVTDQENVLRDSFGRVIGGEAGKVEEVTDMWVFARDTTSPDPNWTLVETRS